MAAAHERVAGPDDVRPIGKILVAFDPNVVGSLWTSGQLPAPQIHNQQLRIVRRGHQIGAEGDVQGAAEECGDEELRMGVLVSGRHFVSVH